MKTRRWAVAALIALTSCTEVKHFGAYWDKGVVDPALAGRWNKMAEPGFSMSSTPGVYTYVFEKDGSSYSLRMINPIDPRLPADEAARQKADNETRYAVRTLTIGGHTFFMVKLPPGPPGQQDGIVERYDISGGVLREYHMDARRTSEWLEAKHPTAKNISVTTGDGAQVTIDTFDDDVFRLLSEVADDPKYWGLVERHRKVTK